MKKRGQATVFVVIGITLVILIFLLLFFKENITKAIQREPTDPQQYLSQQLNDIKKELGKCVSSETSEASKILMSNSGSFDRDFNYLVYSGKKYPILCRELEDQKGCLSEPLIVPDFQESLNKKLPGMIKNCLNLEAFENRDYEVDTGDLEVNSMIKDSSILVDVDFSIELKKGIYSVKENKFIYSLDIPLGDLIKVVNELIQKEAGGEDVDPIYYMLLNKNKYKIDVKKPYPDKLYEISLSNNDNYVFYFAVEGIGRFERTASLK